MKIAFLSTRGIPNNYGGFEQFAEYISVGLVQRGHEVTVYSPHFHPYKNKEFKGVRIKHIKSPENWLGSSFGSFFYDFRCLRDALKKENFDIIYECGYTSMIPAYIWFNVKNRKNVIVTTNMDGLEYKRSKFNTLVRKFLFWEERMAVKHSHYLVADNMGISNYYREKYGKPSTFLAYGADIHDDYDSNLLSHYNLSVYGYYLIIARIEPENNIEMAIEGYLASKEKDRRPLIIVGKTNTSLAIKLIKKYGDQKSVKFFGGIYDFKKLDSIRHFSYAYFHGHSVGGTNPSLLEAMASGVFMLAHDNVFNRTVLHNNAFYYNDKTSVAYILDKIDTIVAENKQRIVDANLNEINTNYSWENLINEHEKYFYWLMEDKGKNRLQNL